MFPQITELPDGVEVRRDDRRWTDHSTGEVITSVGYGIYEDGEREPGRYIYRTHEDAVRTVLAQAEHEAAKRIIEDTIGQERHYGIRVWSEPHPVNPAPTWRITDPHRGHDGFAFAWHSHTPPPVEVYTRAQYEAACTALGLEAAPDSEFARGGNYMDRYGNFTSHENGARVVVEAALRRRRIAGVQREEAGVRASARDAVREAAGTGPYSRAQYEAACASAGVPPREDRVCLLLQENALSHITHGLLMFDPQAPTEELEKELALARGAHLMDNLRYNTQG